MDNNQCCPKCSTPKNSCKYEGYLIDVSLIKISIRYSKTVINFFFIKHQHNTEFSPKICTTCKCRDGLIECANTCKNKQQQQQQVTDEDLCYENGVIVKCKKEESFCQYDNREHQNNTIWSPIPCTQCKCENSNVNCYVIECPILDCPFVS